jgi:hypothetical protein
MHHEKATSQRTPLRKRSAGLSACDASVCGAVPLEKDLAIQHGEEPDKRSDQYIREAEDEAKRALAIYDRHREGAAQAGVREKQAAVAEMRAAGLTHIADAYEREYYNELNI